MFHNVADSGSIKRYIEPVPLLFDQLGVQIANDLCTSNDIMINTNMHSWISLLLFAQQHLISPMYLQNWVESFYAMLKYW